MRQLSPDRAEMVTRLAARTVGLIEHEYPNSIRLTMTAPPEALVTPRAIYPAFFGCYDWHSAVHSHWQLVRALRFTDDSSLTEAATAALDRTLTPTNVAIEMRWVAARPGFEMPYGMAWLLTLCRELRDWDDRRARRWHAALEPMEAHAIERFRAYCAALTVPMRGGLHNQTAFSLALVWDAAPELPRGRRRHRPPVLRTGHRRRPPARAVGRRLPVAGTQ